uniref:Uncharacterized protein n=1 Tax=Osugoroshi virus TaxID=2202814 RepID=A0A7R7T1R4_9VIRU|nr:hypothetical protein [Osugoroshi virus]
MKDPPDIFIRDRVYTTNCSTVHPNPIPIPLNAKSFAQHLPTSLVVCIDYLNQYKFWLLSAERQNDASTIDAILGIVSHLRFSYITLSKLADSESQLYVQQYIARFPDIVDEYYRQLDHLSTVNGDNSVADSESDVHVTDSNLGNSDDDSIYKSEDQIVANLRDGTSTSGSTSARTVVEHLSTACSTSSMRTAPNSLRQRDAEITANQRVITMMEQAIRSFISRGIKRSTDNGAFTIRSSEHDLLAQKPIAIPNTSKMKYQSKKKKIDMSDIECTSEYLKFPCRRSDDKCLIYLTAFDGEVLIPAGMYVKRRRFMSFRSSSDVSLDLRYCLNWFEEFDRCRS